MYCNKQCYIDNSTVIPYLVQKFSWPWPLTLKNASMANIGIYTYYHNSSLRNSLRIKWKKGVYINCANTVQFFIEHKVLD